ncbi:MAG TPA: hypothetical protein VHT26_07665 [Trebonia sp.]|jgi:hypothetical protein|nr:hypothetical protein [Trebonia sp.]
MAGSVTWTIGVPTETTGLSDAGMPVKGLTVPFKLDNGIAGSVFVPEGQTSASNITALVSAKAAALVGIKGLTGTVQGV